MKLLILLVLTFVTFNLLAQDINFEKISKTPKDTSLVIPLDYKISRPRLEFPGWNVDFEAYYKFVTPTIRKTQLSLGFNEKGVKVSLTSNSAIPHAQLDTTTGISDYKKIIGTWRMIKYRSINFNDSVYIPTTTYYRLPDVLIEDKSKDDEAFAVIDENNFKIYVKELGKVKFKKMVSAKYKMENSRFILIYKGLKASGGVSQIGIDEKGYLILNYPKVIERVKDGKYISYYAIIEQYIFEKVK
jgi:hypothetical protein